MGSLQLRVVLLCSVVAFLDGFDMQSVGPAAKEIATDLNVLTVHFGWLSSAFQIGFLTGSMVFGPLGDRLGRKWPLVGTTALFAVCSLAMAVTSSFDLLLFFRLFAGIGLGGATPIYVSLASDQAPPDKRARVVTLMSVAVPLGGMAAGLVSSVLIPMFGWRAVFFLGGIVPLAATAVIAVALPKEDVKRRPAAGQRIGTTTTVQQLFVAEERVKTTWLWLTSLMVWSALVVNAFWSPTLMQQAGWSVATAGQMTGVYNLGGVLGTIAIGAAPARLRSDQVLMIALAVGGILIALVGLSLGSKPLMTGVVFLSGFCTSAAGYALLAFSATVYSAFMRATGVGWALGFGRIGAVLAPPAAGFLVAGAFPVEQMYLFFGVPFVLASVFVSLLWREMERRPSQTRTTTGANPENVAP